MTYSQLHISSPIGLHSVTCADSVLATDHFDKSVTLINVDNASLNDAKSVKERT